MPENRDQEMLTKGKRVSITSPLSPEARTFLLQFDTEQVLSDRELNEDQRTIACIQELHLPNRAHERRKSAACKRLQARWSKDFGVVRVNSRRARWWTVAGGRSLKGSYGQKPPVGWPEEPPAWDHGELWGHGRTPSIAVSQPYPWLLNKDIDCLNDFAEQYGLRFRISNYPSWYFPGRCWFVMWFQEVGTNYAEGDNQASPIRSRAFKRGDL